MKRCPERPWYYVCLDRECVSYSRFVGLLNCISRSHGACPNRCHGEYGGDPRCDLLGARPRIEPFLLAATDFRRGAACCCRCARRTCSGGSSPYPKVCVMLLERGGCCCSILPVLDYPILFAWPFYLFTIYLPLFTGTLYICSFVWFCCSSYLFYFAGVQIPLRRVIFPLGCASCRM